MYERKKTKKNCFGAVPLRIEFEGPPTFLKGHSGKVGGHYFLHAVEKVLLNRELL